LKLLQKPLLTLLNHDKRIGIWGVPLCVVRTMFNAYIYMRFFETHIAENPMGVKTKIFLNYCDKCIDRLGCLGFRNIKTDTLKPTIKSIHNQYNNGYLKKPFNSTLNVLNQKHALCVHHCQTDSKTTFRHIYYADSVSMNSKHAYTNRFIYSCDYLNSEESEFEFSFLENIVFNKKMVYKFKSLFKTSNNIQLIYSLAEKKGSYRETFYYFVPSSVSSNFLQNFNLTFDEINYVFFGIGIDSINSELTGYKIYYKVSQSIMLTYLEKIGIKDYKFLGEKLFIVYRLNKNEDILSYKIEIEIKHQDLKYFKLFLNNYNYYAKLDTKNITIEILEDKIEKVNIYYASRQKV